MRPFGRWGSAETSGWEMIGGETIDADANGRLLRHGVIFGYEISDVVQRIACAPTLEILLQSDNDLCLPVILPCNFVVYANDLVSQAQASAGLKETKILELAIREFNFLGRPGAEKEGLFIWRIGPEMVWQQLDRRLDEVFEVLFAFPWANSDLNEDLQAQRFAGELSRGERRRQEENEFDAFTRWVAGHITEKEEE
ncbi:hypothetical protein DFH07DRAFT_967330 [Mycena maculata]|uniref:Uncharacterized protein n=1 Tax=Mycena maculata TaxID=230809 RepID=A0AAD7I646_9AGAR|nr:hypothetical protein DFH07DRAFT_967330 [Mycena maculata]